MRISGGVVALLLAVGVACTVIHNVYFSGRALYLHESLVAEVAGADRSSRLRPYLFDTDSHYWLHYAQEMAAKGKLTVRSTSVDNTPFGREVHWSSLFAWWLVVGGRVVSWATGTDLREGINTFAPYASPILMAVLLSGLFIWVGRALGFRVAAVFAGVCLTSAPFIWDFSFGTADHHGLHDFAVILTLLPAITMAYGRSTGGAAFYGVLSGVGAGLGVWLGATTQIVVSLGFLGMAGALSVLEILRPGEPLDAQRARRTREIFWWGFAIAAGTTSVVAFLIEYGRQLGAPLRLEVNNPIYAISLFCGGALVAVLKGFHRGRLRVRGVVGVILLIGTLLPIAAFLFGPTEWHTLRDPILKRILKVGVLNQSLASSYGFAGDPLAEVALPVALVLFAGCLAALGIVKRGASDVESLSLATGVACLLGILTIFFQVRWAGMFVAASAVVAAGACMVFSRTARAANVGARFASTSILAASVVIGLSLAFQNATRLNPALVSVWASSSIASLRIEETIRLQSGSDAMAVAPRVLAHRFLDGEARDLALRFGIPVLGSRYWENLDGLRDEARFFGTSSTAEAAEVLERRGITHVVTLKDSTAVLLKHFVWTGLKDPEAALESFGARLALDSDAIPEWLEPVAGFHASTLGGVKLRLFRVNPAKFSTTEPE